ncbi:hypothetical protein ABZT34_30250 [Streptomyces sp. NPDC005329]
MDEPDRPVRLKERERVTYGGRRAGGLTVEFTDIDYIDFGLLS